MKLILTDIDDTILKFSEAFEQWMTSEKGYTLNQPVQETGCIVESFQLGLRGERVPLVDDLIIEFSTDPHHFSTIAPFADAKVVIPVLATMGYQFVAISSCVDGPAVTAARRLNLEVAFGVPWQDVHCTGLLQPKGAFLERYPSTWWIEDNAGHAVHGASLGHRTLLLDRPYNKLDPEKEATITRVRDWYAVLNQIILADGEPERRRKSIDEQLLSLEREDRLKKEAR